MKAALGVQLANSLAAAYGHSATASEDYVEVLLDGFAFRLMLYSGRDEAMLTKIASMAAPSGPGGAAAGVDAGAVGMGAAGTGTGTVGAGVLSPEESPLMLSWHHGLVSHVAGANCAYAPAARLAQRWLAAHLMSNHVAPAAAELLVAAAFGGAGGPATAPPGSRLSGGWQAVMVKGAVVALRVLAAALCYPAATNTLQRRPGVKGCPQGRSCRLGKSSRRRRARRLGARPPVTPAETRSAHCEFLRHVSSAPYRYPPLSYITAT